MELTKMYATDNALIATAEWGKYQAGKHCPDQSLPNGYWLTGFLLEHPKVGRQLKVLRLSRNGVKILGIYTSSTVTEINGDQLRTQNSIYRLRYIDVSLGELQSLLASLTEVGLSTTIVAPSHN